MRFRCKTKPWDHQKRAVKYLYQRDTAALYTDMGTGKTKIMIDLIQNRNFNRVLVVAPNKACEVWEQQIGIHGIDNVFDVYRLNQLSVIKVSAELDKIPKWGSSVVQDRTYVFIINYEKVWRPEVAKRLLKKSFGLDCVICDESHRIKSPSSQCSRMLSKLGKIVSHRYLVTGTPLAENPVDVYAQYRFLDPSIFGTNLYKMREEYENLDPVMTARIGHRILDKNNPYKNLDKLREKMFSCAFYVESPLELPEQTDITVTVQMPLKTEKLYHEMVKEKVAEFKGDFFADSENALTSILRLQQMTSGFLPAENPDTGEKKIITLDHAKQNELQGLLEGFAEDEPIVVFANYKKDLKNIRTACENLGYLYSEVSGSEDTLYAWKQEKTKVLGVQYTSGSESIDLTRARYCIYYSQTRRLALYEQSRKRIHRPGQDKPVVYYHLIETMRKGLTMDEIMRKALDSKKGIVDYVMEKGWE